MELLRAILELIADVGAQVIGSGRRDPVAVLMVCVGAAFLATAIAVFVMGVRLE